MLKILTTLLLVISLQAKDNFTVDDLILEALKNSPDLKASASEYEASKSRYDTAHAGYLPNINLHLDAGQMGRSDIPTNKDSMINDTLILGQLSLKQLIYDFGKTEGSVDKFKYDSDSYSSSNQQLISDKKRDVKQAYYAVLQAIALINVHKENVKLMIVNFTVHKNILMLE